MKKLQSARDHLLASPLGIQGEKLLTVAERGTITTYRGTDAQNHDFQVGYTAHLIVTDFAGDPLSLFYVMIAWLERECADARPDAIRFHVDVIDSRQVDVSLLIELTETVTITRQPTGTTLTPDVDGDALAAALFP